MVGYKVARDRVKLGEGVLQVVELCLHIARGSRGVANGSAAGVRAVGANEVLAGCVHASLSVVVEEKPADARSADGKARAGLDEHGGGNGEWVPDWDGWLAGMAARRAAAQGGGGHGSALCLCGLGGWLLHAGAHQVPVHLVVEVFAGDTGGSEHDRALFRRDAPRLEPVLDVLPQDAMPHCFCQLGRAAFEGFDSSLDTGFVCHGGDFNAK